jgi:hypothetical protein
LTGDLTPGIADKMPHTTLNDDRTADDSDAVELLKPTSAGRVTLPDHVLSQFDEGQRFYPVVQDGVIRLEPLKVDIPWGGDE